MTAAPSDVDDTETARAVRRHRRWPWIVGTVVVLLVVLGAMVAVVWGGRDAREASVDDALTRFRRSDVGAAAEFLLPEPGVYTYRGVGSEQLSVLDAKQHWGAHVPVTVSKTDPRCWTLRIDYSSHHRQDFDYCARGSTLVEMGGRTTQRFDFGLFQADDRTEFTCTPAGVAIRVDAPVGEHWKQTCTGRSAARDTEVTASGTNRFVGIRRLRVGRRVIDAYAYRVDRRLTGDQSGVEHNRIWFASGSGLPVKYVRNTRVESPSPVGDVTYSEQGTLTLLTLRPQR